MGVFYRNNRGALYYLNKLYDTAPEEIKLEIERVSQYIQQEVSGFEVSKHNKKDLGYKPGILEEGELIRITILTLNIFSGLYKEDFSVLINYVRKVRIKYLGGIRK